MLLCIMGTLLLSIVTGMSLSLKLRREKKSKREKKNGLKVLPILSKHCLKLQVNALLRMLK